MSDGFQITFDFITFRTEAFWADIALKRLVLQRNIESKAYGRDCDTKPAMWYVA